MGIFNLTRPAKSRQEHKVLDSAHDAKKKNTYFLNIIPLQNMIRIYQHAEEKESDLIVRIACNSFG